MGVKNMKTKFEQKLKILSSQLDHHTELGLIQSLSLLQDNMCEYYRNLKSDGPTMIPSHHAFFVVTKTKLRMIKTCKWLDEVKLVTDVAKLSNVRMNIVNNIYNASDEPCVVGVQEMCAMDSDNRKLRLINTTNFPADAEVVDNEFGLEFSKFDDQFEEDSLVEIIKIKSTNIDVYRHTNNIEYAKFILSTFSSNELDLFRIKEFEIHYINETREDDELKIYKKLLDNSYVFAIKKDDKIVCKAKLDFE